MEFSEFISLASTTLAFVGSAAAFYKANNWQDKLIRLGKTRDLFEKDPDVYKRINEIMKQIANDSCDKENPVIALVRNMSGLSTIDKGKVACLAAVIVSVFVFMAFAINQIISFVASLADACGVVQALLVLASTFVVTLLAIGLLLVVAGAIEGKLSK
jgi:hypothetical protein